MPMGRFRLTAPAARTTARIVLAATCGAVVGIAAYSISRTGGQLLSVTVGGLVGIGLAVGLDFYRRSVQLSEVSLVVLGSTMTFTATTDMRQAAQRAFFQAATRVATRPLEDGSGNLREALTSLKNLFDLYREPLESGAAPLPSPKGDSVHELVLEILNSELGPFLAKWHPRLRAWEESAPPRSEGGAEGETEGEAEGGADRAARRGEADWPENAAFREDLRALQTRLRPYVVGLGRIAGLRDPERHLPRPSRTAGDGLPAQATAV